MVSPNHSSPGAQPNPVPRRSLLEERQDVVPSLVTGSLLAAAGGFLDAFTYTAHGHVFANAMTGNVVLLGINCISGNWHVGFRHLPPIIAFLVGILCARAITQSAKQGGFRFPYLAALTLEICILAALSLLPNSTPDFWITTSIAFAASIQVGTFRDVHGHSYNSTFTTGNLRTLSESVFDWLFVEKNSETARLVGDFALICASFFTGALVGAFATPRMGNRALWIDLVPLLIVAIRVWPRSPQHLAV